MLKNLVTALHSMFKYSQRHPNRTWGEELLVRNFRLTFDSVIDAARTLEKFDMGDIPAMHPSLLKTRRTQTTIAGVSCTLVRPKANNHAKRVIVYLHGGAYVVGSPQTHRALLAQLAVNSDALVIAADYRLGPEHVYPAAYEDCCAVTKAVLTQYSHLPVTLAGDSAGGALAIAVALAIGESSSVNKLDSLLAMSPWIDPLAEEGSIVSNASYDYMTQADLAFMYRKYIGQADPANPESRLVGADLSALPRTCVQYGEAEIFHDQIEAFCNTALDSGVNISAEKFLGQPHVFQLLSPLTSASRRATHKIADFINWQET